MEQHKLRRAADQMNQLLKAHVSDSAEEVDVHDAIAARDDLRQLADELDNKYDLPNVGDRLHDPCSPSMFGTGEVEVKDVHPNQRSDMFQLKIDGRWTTVAEQNPGEPADAPVVEAVYVGGSDKTYTFPVTRLK